MTSALLLALPLAWAGLPADGIKHPTTGTEIVEALALLADAGNETIVFACGGHAACEIATAIRDGNPGLGLVVVSGARDDLSAEAMLALVDDEHLSCGVWLEGEPGSLWARTLGSCDPQAPRSPESFWAEAGGAPVGTDESQAAASSRSGLPGTIDHLAELDPTERRAALLSGLDPSQDDGESAKIAAALAVSEALAAQERDDPTVVRLFLRAAFSDEAHTRSAAMVSANSGGDPPLTGPPPPAAERAAIHLEPFCPDTAASREPRLRWVTSDARQTYVAERLVRDDIAFRKLNVGVLGVYREDIHTWGVFEGDGQPLAADDFARRVKDGITLTDIELELQSARTDALVWGLAGAASMVAGLAVERSAKGYNRHDPAFVLRAAGGGALLVAGSAGVGLSVAITQKAKRKRQLASAFYSEVEADGLIQRHNAALREQLGLTESDTLEYDYPR